MLYNAFAIILSLRIRMPHNGSQQNYTLLRQCLWAWCKFKFKNNKMGIALKKYNVGKLYASASSLLSILSQPLEYSWSPEICWPAYFNLCRFATCVNRQVSVEGNLTSDLCAWIHWAIVIHISAPAVKHNWSRLATDNKRLADWQVNLYLSRLFVREFVGWSLTF